MRKNEIFDDVINKVSLETGVHISRIMSSCKDAETVDARYILVRILADIGMYPSQIADMIHKTQRTVNYMISNFNDRMNGRKILRIYLENIKKLSGNE